MLKMLKEAEECGKAPVGQTCSSGAYGWICSQQNMGIISSRVHVHIKINTVPSKADPCQLHYEAHIVLQMYQDEVGKITQVNN